MDTHFTWGKDGNAIGEHITECFRRLFCGRNFNLPNVGDLTFPQA